MNIFNRFFIRFVIGTAIALIPWLSYAQTAPTAAILAIDAKGTVQEGPIFTNLLRLELQKIDTFQVVDKYDMIDLLKDSEIIVEECFSKRCLMETGKILNADRMLTGSVERFGEKIMITLRLLDVQKGEFVKTEVSEFLNMQPEIQKMLEMSLNNLFGRANDPMLINNLTYYNTVKVSPTTRIINNGPRMGAAYVFGRSGDRLQAPLNEGGYDVLPVISQFGYQHELQYMSSGNFQALAEFLVMVGGLEQSMFIPSFVILNGFRDSKTGIEFGFGPSISVRKTAEGYFEDGKWKLGNEWVGQDMNGNPIPNPNPITEQLDKRGDYGVFSRWIWSIGKTFRSGYLNIPVNVYASPRKDDWQVGMSMGFNLRRPVQGR